MEAPTKLKSEAVTPESRRVEPELFFDVTCVVGRVHLQADGLVDPYEGAMQVIARHKRDGEYHFPGEHGEVVVTVKGV